MCLGFSWSSSDLGVLYSVVITYGLIHLTVEGAAQETPYNTYWFSLPQLR